MTLHKPYAMQETLADASDILYTAQELRMYSRAIAQMSGNGVLNTGDLAVSQRAAGANFSVDIAAGIAGVLGDDVTNQGLYYAWNDAVFNLVTPSAPGSGTRVHRVVAQIRDKLHNGAWTTYDWTPVLLQDTGTGTPAEPASAVTLALVSISAGDLSVTTGSITDKRLPWNDSFHSLGSHAGAAGWTADRNSYRMVNGNTVEIDFMLHGTSGNGSAGTITYASNLAPLYQPAIDRVYPVSSNSTTDNAFCHVQTDGTVTLIVPAESKIGGLVRMPLN